MKKFLILFSFILLTLELESINIIPSQYVTYKSHSGIIVKSIVINENKSLTVTFSNENSSNYNRTGTYVTYSFDWYLSYKGKRVSDYYSDAIRCGKEGSHTVYFWPNEVPSGNEKYVTVQFKEKTQHVDRRDDF